VPEEYVKRNYERDTLPDPSRYYMKDFAGYTAVYPEVEVISMDIINHIFPVYF
jgi:hypothetical protein